MATEYTQRDPASLNVDAYQYLDSLRLDEYENLKQSIAAQGLIDPVQIDELDNVLDGHHRVKACRELRLASIPVIINRGLTDEQKDIFSVEANVKRRQVTLAECKAKVRELYADGWTQAKIAAAFGVTQGTISKWLSDKNYSNGIITPDEPLDEPTPEEQEKDTIEKVKRLQWLCGEISGDTLSPCLNSKRDEGEVRDNLVKFGAERLADNDDAGLLQAKRNQLWHKKNFKLVADLLRRPEKFNNAEIRFLCAYGYRVDINWLRACLDKTPADLAAFLNDAINYANGIIAAANFTDDEAKKSGQNFKEAVALARGIKYIRRDTIGRENASRLIRLHRLDSIITDNYCIHSAFDFYINLLNAIALANDGAAKFIRKRVEDFFEYCLLMWPITNKATDVLNSYKSMLTSVDASYNAYCQRISQANPRFISHYLKINAPRECEYLWACRFNRICEALKPLHLAAAA